MTSLPIDVEQIVAEVMRRLGPPSAREDAKTAGQGGAAGQGRGEAGATIDKTVVLTQRVVSVADLKQRLDGATTLEISPRSLVTPAARDILKARGIAIRVGWAPPTAPAAQLPLALGVAETNFSPAALVSALQRRGISIQHVARSGLAGVVADLVDLVGKSGHLGLLLTSESAAAVCLANRHRGVRAATAASVDETREAIAAIGANLLVVDPRHVGAFPLARMVADFCCPIQRSAKAQFEV
ncbi:MAG: hypothetical protein HYS13_08530 [Planctomycetia bacterium]|nr:hypothetical protein [Planctomycetia bacterium]